MNPAWTPSQLADWAGGHWQLDPPEQVRSVSHDTRALSAGALYVALRGEHLDGHDFLEAARAAGAVAALVDAPRADAVPAGMGVLVVEDSLQGLQNLAAGYRRSLGIPCWGITGSVGKTSVKELLADCLAREHATCRTAGNWNNDIGLPLSVLRMDAGTEVGVFEAGMNRPGDIARLGRVLAPSFGLLTPVGAAHTEAFSEGEAGVAREKASLLSFVAEDGFCVLSSDLPWFDLLRDAARCRVVTVALRGDASYRGEQRGEELLLYDARGGAHALPLPLAAPFMQRNVLLAAAAALEWGLSPDSVREAVAAFRPPSARWQVIERGEVTWIHDAYNANPLSMKAALESFDRHPVQGTRWLFLGGMRELGAESRERHLQLGRRCAGLQASLIAVGPLARPLVDGALEGGLPNESVYFCADVEEGADLLAARLRPGDAVLLKGSRGERLERVLDDPRFLPPSPDSGGI